MPFSEYIARTTTMNGNKETVGELYEAFQQCVQLFKVKDYDGAETILTSTTELGKRVLKQNIRSNNCQEIYEIRAILSRLYVYKARLCCTNVSSTVLMLKTIKITDILPKCIVDMICSYDFYPFCVFGYCESYTFVHV